MGGDNVCDDKISNACYNCPFFIQSCSFCQLNDEYIDDCIDVVKELYNNYEVENYRIYEKS